MRTHFLSCFAFIFHPIFCFHPSTPAPFLNPGMYCCSTDNSRTPYPGPQSRLFSRSSTTVRTLHFYLDKSSAFASLVGVSRIVLYTLRVDAFDIVSSPPPEMPPSTRIQLQQKTIVISHFHSNHIQILCVNLEGYLVLGSI